MPDVKRTCRLSGEEFLITEGDQKFYKRINVPLPTLSPNMRRLRRLSFRNERNLYQRKCSLTGENILSNFSPDKPYKVHNHESWWEDKRDALEFGKPYDFGRPFFEQFDELLHDAPFIQFVVVNCENSDYTNYSWFNKNCYLLFDAGWCENVYYSDTMYHSNFCFDCFHCKKGCELCYECMDCNQCYHCVTCIYCHNSTDLNFCYDCNGCENCFMCWNLRNKKYHYKNKQYSKEEYEKILKENDLGNRLAFEKTKREFLDLKAKEAIHHYSNNINAENCTGAFLINCKNCDYCFDCSHVEDGKFLYDGADPGGKNYYDDDRSGVGCELSYETIGNPEPYNSKFIVSCGYPKFTEYCIFCHNPINCFGCFGLKKGQYCILNKQYKKEEYEELLPRIIEHMKSGNSYGQRADGKSGRIGPGAECEYGEFFPMRLSPFAYNETLAYDYYPLSKEQVLKLGLKWKDAEEKKYVASSLDVPDNIRDVNENILKAVLSCEVSGKNYKVLKQELDFYKKMNLPIPRKCPDERYKERLALRPPYKLWDRTCSKTGKPIKSCYDPDGPEKVYSEEAYLGAVYIKAGM